MGCGTRSPGLNSMPERILLLLFYLGNTPFALPARDVVEVVPFAILEAIPHAPPSVVGLLHYRGAIVPVLDLCRLVYEQACRIRMSTRIILVHYPPDDPQAPLLGLLAERVTDMLSKQPSDMMPAGIALEESPYLGNVFKDLCGLVRCLRVEKVLPDSIKRGLFHESGSNVGDR